MTSSSLRRMADSEKHKVTDSQVDVLEAITRKVSVKKAKQMADATQQEYILDEAKARVQEDTVRKVNQKMVDKAMDVRRREGGREGMEGGGMKGGREGGREGGRAGGKEGRDMEGKGKGGRGVTERRVKAYSYLHTGGTECTCAGRRW